MRRGTCIIRICTLTQDAASTETDTTQVVSNAGPYATGLHETSPTYHSLCSLRMLQVSDVILRRHMSLRVRSLVIFSICGYLMHTEVAIDKGRLGPGATDHNIPCQIAPPQ